MIVRSFLSWFETAPVGERVEAAHAMAQAYLSAQLGADRREDAEAALTLILDDPSPLVRRALAWEFAAASDAPRHIVVALAHDQADVAALVLARSPLLRDADLVDCAAVGCALTQTAIALRPEVSFPVSAALIDCAGEETLAALLRNPNAEISAISYARLAEVHAGSGLVREAMSQREDLPVSVRQALVAALSQDLARFVSEKGWMPVQRIERAVADTRETATIALSAEAEDLADLVDHLRVSGQLTPGLLLRGLLCGDTALFGAALASLTGIDPRRIAGMMTGLGQGALAAACLRAGLPQAHIPAFLAAAGAAHRLGMRDAGEPRLNRAIIQAALAASIAGDESALRPLLALLRRFDAEAARLDAREITARILAERETDLLEATDATAGGDADESESAGPLLIDTSDLATSERSLVDLDLLAADLMADAAPAAEARREPMLTAEPARSGQDNLDSLFQSAFGASRSQEDDVAPPAPLHVVESLDGQLDEAFFANVELRKSAA